MKKKYVAVLLGITLGLSVLSGCSSTTTKNQTETTSESEEKSEDAIYGEVSKVDGDTITIKTGTKKEIKEGEQPDGSMLELTGDKQKITVTDDTKITRQTMGGAPQGGQLNGDGNSQPPEKPDGDDNNQPQEKPDGDDNNQPPEKPDGDNNDQSTEKTDGDTKNQNTEKTDEDTKDQSAEKTDENSNNQSTEKTDENNDNQSSEKPDGNNNQPPQESTEEITLDDISKGDIIEVTLDEDGNAETIKVMPTGGGGPEQSAGVDSYEAVEEYKKDTEVEGETIASTGTDENAIHVTDGAKASLKKVTVTRDSEDSKGGDNSSFYGVGAAVLNTDGTAYISDSKIDTDAAGAAGVFAYGDGTVYVADTDITTKKDTSGGIHAAGGGTLYAWDLNVETNGQSSAAIRSDRGGGKMVVDGGSYTSNGTGSPAVYSTADIAVHDATLNATGSEAVCIEGLNSLHLYDTSLTGNMSDDEQNDCTWNVILYQSMSGDSEVGNSTFEMDGGSLTAKNGGMFYTTNTESTFTLKNVDITYANDSEFFLRCTGNNNQRGWGKSKSNGADCLFTAIEQKMEGNIIWDSISQLDFYMTDGSTLKGAVVNDETYAGDGGDGYCNLYIEKGSTWTVTGDSTVSTLQCAGSIVDENGKSVTVKGSDGTVYVKGDSSYTVTVDSYKDSVDSSGAAKTTAWSSYETEKPEEL